MPRGEDTSRDPKRKVTRLAHLISTHSNRSWRAEGYYPSDGLDTTPEDAQEDLDEYRKDRDTPGLANFEVKEVKRLAGAYGESFKNRHNDSYVPGMYYPFTGVTE